MSGPRPSGPWGAARAAPPPPPLARAPRIEGGLKPRLVLVTRRTELELLLARHGTRGQAAFVLSRREQSIEPLEHRHRLQETAVAAARRALPDEWSLAEVERGDLDRFLFAPGDVVVALGQDGLVANLAKYAAGRPVIGAAPDPSATEGVLTPLSVAALPGLLPAVAAGEARIERRAMVEARLDDGQRLVALNELFVGHRSHQSARYDLAFDGRRETQSSSGLIVATGTGLTGWARSILQATARQVEIAAHERRAVFLAREPWPSRTTGTELALGLVQEGRALSVVSRMDEGGVIFADGIETDHLRLDWGREATVGLAEQTLDLVRG